MEIKLKRVTEDDLYNLMVWRMRPDISRYMMTVSYTHLRAHET